MSADEFWRDEDRVRLSTIALIARVMADIPPVYIPAYVRIPPRDGCSHAPDRVWIARQRAIESVAVRRSDAHRIRPATFLSAAASRGVGTIGRERLGRQRAGWRM